MTALLLVLGACAMVYALGLVIVTIATFVFFAIYDRFDDDFPLWAPFAIGAMWPFLVAAAIVGK